MGNKVDDMRYLWLLRAQCLFFVLCVVVFAILWVSFSSIDPGLKYEAFLVSANPSVESVFVQRAPKNISQESANLVIAKNMATKYIVARESLSADKAMQAERTADVRTYSSDDVWDAFSKSAESAIRMDNPSRRITAVSIKPEDITFMPKSGTLDAPVTLINMDANGMNRSTSIKRVSMRVAFSSGKGQASWVNPLGFKVEEYTIK